MILHASALVQWYSQPHISGVQDTSLGEAKKIMAFVLLLDSSLIVMVWARELVSLSSHNGDYKSQCFYTILVMVDGDIINHTIVAAVLVTTLPQVIILMGGHQSG